MGLKRRFYIVTTNKTGEPRFVRMGGRKPMAFPTGEAAIEQACSLPDCERYGYALLEFDGDGYVKAHD